jgi:PAS domain S-box-containing protein
MMEQLRQEYAELLAIHLECPEELHLFEAYTFGKKCAEKGIPASEVINSHFEILENGEVPLGEERVLDSQEFLLETILAIAASSSSVIEATMPEKVLAVLYNEAATRFRELREVKERLRVSESKYRELYDEAMAMLCSIDQNGSITICNNTMAKNLGYEKEDLIGKQVATILSPECVERVWNKESGSLRGQEEVECLLLKRDGQAIRALVQAKAVFSEDVMPSHFDFTCRDITERKRAEEEQEKLHEQLRQAQKMESIGRLAGGVAHDFNNMLSIILGYTEMALDGMEPALPLFARLHEIRKAAERSANLTQQLLAFARKQTVAPKVIDLNKTVDGMLKMLRRLIREDIDLSWLPGSGLWPVKIDPLQIDQILANLCVNARDAITGVGKLTIETENTVFDEAYCAEHAGFVCGEYLLLAVSDDGCGMNKETLEKIFEPFFTTKGAGKGTGLGLATVYGIVKQNSGFMNVTSEPGHGTTFRIYLPRHKGEANCIPEEGAPAHATRGDQTILLVED